MNRDFEPTQSHFSKYWFIAAETPESTLFEIDSYSYTWVRIIRFTIFSYISVTASSWSQISPLCLRTKYSEHDTYCKVTETNHLLIHC